MPSHVLGIDPSRENCGYCVLSFDGNNIIPVMYGTVNLNTDKGETEFFKVLEYCNEKLLSGEFSGIFYENATFNVGYQAKQAATTRKLTTKETEKLGQNIRRGQKGSVGLVLGMAAVYRLKPYGHLMADAQIGVSTNKASLTGHGMANKEQMIHAVKVRYNLTVDEHTADAIGIALAGVKRIYSKNAGKGKR